MKNDILFGIPMLSMSGDIVCYSMLQIVYWWLVRVTLVVALGFLPQSLGDGGDL